MRLMAKYSSLDGRKRKVYTSKAELPEAQVLTAIHGAVTYGFPQKRNGCEVMAHDGLKRYTEKCEGIFVVPTIRTQPSLRAYDG
jgi:hypothetical protein